jgi:hypothetical protein
LFNACLRQAIFQISNGSDPAKEIQAARTRFLSAAANPGLDLSEGQDSWVVANDYAGMLATVLTAISRLTLLTLKRVDATPVGSWQWSPLAWADDSSLLHRWITVDRFDNDTLTREAHGWYVFGDIACCDAPLTLHVIDIGQQRNGRRASAWVRAYKHPAIAHRYKFVRKNSKGHATSLSDQWIPIYYADQPSPDPETWVDLMDADQVTPTLLHHIPIAQPTEAVRRDTLGQLERLATRMQRMMEERMEPMGEPMARGQCDGIVPCPWQECCFVPDPLNSDIGASGLYQIRVADASKHSDQPRLTHPAIV